MTVCNMSIEAGARAGMIAPDETTFAYLQGRPHAPQGADWDAAVDVLARRCAPTTTPSSTARSSSTRPTLTPVRHLGHQPRPGRCRSSASVPDPADIRRRRRARRPPSARWSTWA